MATKESLIKSKLQSKVFNVIGKTVTFKKKSSPVYNNRGEEETYSYTASTITIVPYNTMYNRESFSSFGDLKEGEQDAAIPYTVDIEKGDRITIESEDWIVKELEKNYLPGNVVTIVRLTRALDWGKVVNNYANFITSNGNNFITYDGDTFTVIV